MAEDAPQKDAPEKEATAKPHYLGHRERLREKFLEQGPDSLADYEIIELLLTLARPRIDCKPIAKALLKQFGSLPALMAANTEALKSVDDVGDSTVIALKLVQAVAQRMLKREVLDKPVLDSWNRVLDYCHSVMAHQREEQLRLFFLDGRNALVADEMQSKGTVNHTPLYVREVVKRALELGASALIMAHNHPTGDPSPSRDDIALTREVRNALKAVGVSLHDHIIIGRKGHVSLRSMNVIDGWK
ncbi:MAG TPA: DNA repair protein RadC [Dongiaceae bacterium]|nr:DNA repair protein RadC [Dongiaceae bacterium]